MSSLLYHVYYLFVVAITNHWLYREQVPQLARFKGRPGELSPKARFWLFAGWLLPQRFKYVLLPPFTPEAA